jgi:hypothetical protein
MQLAKLRVYLGTEPTSAGQQPVLVLDDGERIILRADGDPTWVLIGLARLIAEATALRKALGADQLPEAVAR